MTEGLLGHCKAALSNLISSEKIQGSDDPVKSFSEAILNFHSHYCLDDHSSPWCCHEKVGILYSSVSSQMKMGLPTRAHPVLRARPQLTVSKAC